MLPASCTLTPASCFPASCYPAPCSLLPCSARLAVLGPEGRSDRPGLVRDGPARQVRPVPTLSPEARSGEAGKQGSREAGRQGSRGRGWWGTQGHALGHAPGYTTPPYTAVRPPDVGRTGGRTGRNVLWAQQGSQGPGGQGSHPAKPGGVTVSSAVLARSAVPAFGRNCK